jgi:hypothetical protein
MEDDMIEMLSGGLRPGEASGGKILSDFACRSRLKTRTIAALK